MAKYRKRPLMIETIQWLRMGDHPEVTEYFPEWFTFQDSLCPNCGLMRKQHGQIDTLEGLFAVCPGDWIITGVEGEHYPCKDSVFRKTYEPV